METIKIIGISILAYFAGISLGFLVVRKIIHNIIFWVFSLFVGKTYTSGYDYRTHSTYEWLEINPIFIFTNWTIRIIAELFIAYFVFYVFKVPPPILYFIVVIVFYILNSFSEYKKHLQNSLLDKSLLDFKFPAWYLFCIMGGVIIGSVISLLIIF